ncbi:enzyme of heme biosynthesis [marine bacterium AO1-C]|nr:enzyme of heme biosynthesis [marine bacterium AO1-C]
MSQTRIEQLLTFLEEEPNEPFNLYALALEYTKTDSSQAMSYFEQLLTKHPQYVATYYHAGKLYEELEMEDKAEEVYKKGVEIATEQNEALALRELKNAYQEFLDFKDM